MLFRSRNIAHHLALLNVPVQLVTILGDDPDGKWLLDQCKDAGIGVEHILLANETTGTFASIATPSGDLHIGAVTSETDRLLSIDFLASRSDVLRSAAVVIADCNLSVQALRWLMQFCNEHNVPLVVDAGIGLPSHAAQALELGYDAVLLNTAVAKAGDPVKMAEAFARAIEAGRLSYHAGAMEERDMAVPSTPVLGLAFSETL